MSRASKFKGIFDAAKAQTSDESEEPAAQERPTTKRVLAQPEPAVEPPTPKRRGRPPGGKRNDPEYEQVSAYIRKEVYRKVKIAVLEDGQKQEFSELVDQLLTQWLQARS